ncbi:VOC family protein [Catellatospora bangladeshensis]|uniref:Glyoxalase n=1 Tax=Catellatospora bangladeshensis TaxID=310355 RepID=A0A8J3NLD4_9ACTN|nr:VOC family protein [Catellatospora bangladeshensis]GIF83983.1 glyoxalase [Catellatospora bangladeshensis]
MATRIQVTIDCADPNRLVEFWAAALHYRPQQPPEDHPTWKSYWLSKGIPEDELEGAENTDSIEDPDGVGPRFWFQRVPESKAGKNRLHLDLSVSGGRAVPVETRRERVHAEAERLIALGATRLRILYTEGVDHYGETLQDPEGNEFCLH